MADTGKLQLRCVVDLLLGLPLPGSRCSDSDTLCLAHTPRERLTGAPPASPANLLGCHVRCQKAPRAHFVLDSQSCRRSSLSLHASARGGATRWALLARKGRVGAVADAVALLSNLDGAALLPRAGRARPTSEPAAIPASRGSSTYTSSRSSRAVLGDAALSARTQQPLPRALLAYGGARSGGPASTTRQRWRGQHAGRRGRGARRWVVTARLVVRVVN
jgi:hypothetical protein